MTSTSGTVEHRLTAFLGNEDSIDIPNIIHSTEGAKQYGFQGALVGGATVYGWATPAIVEALGEGWLDHGWAEIAFRRPTYPGDALSIRVAPEGDGTSTLAIAHGDAANISGTLGLGDAPWLSDLHLPEHRPGEERPATLPRLTLDVAPVGQDLRPMPVALDPAEERETARTKQRSDDPRFVGERPLLHPSTLAALMIRFLHHSYDYGPAIHARSHVQHLGRIECGQRITVVGRFMDAYERKGHHYGVIDGLVVGEDGRDLARLRHTTIFEVAKRGDAG